MASDRNLLFLTQMTSFNIRLNMLRAIAQFETEIRAELQMDGINKAKERGVAFGRKRKMTPKQIDELRERRKEGVLIKTLMADYNLSKASVYRYLNQKES